MIKKHLFAEETPETTTFSSNFLEATTSAAKTALEVARAALGKFSPRKKQFQKSSKRQDYRKSVNQRIYISDRRVSPPLRCP